MFNKEAEEYVNTHVAPPFSISEQDLYYCFQRAATFGYNKAKEELEEQNANLIAMLEAEREVRVNDDYLKGICERDAEIDELKEQLECAEHNCKVKQEFNDNQFKAIMDFKKQAKKIVKHLLPSCRNYPDNNLEWIKKAEQFLRDIDIDNAIQQSNQGLDFDHIADEMKQDLEESCPDCFCEDCAKDCEMTEEEIKGLAREYIDSCTTKAGFVILTEGIKSDFIDLFVAGFMKCAEFGYKKA